MKILGLDLSLSSAGVACIEIMPDGTITYNTDIFRQPERIVKDGTGLKNAVLNLHYQEAIDGYLDKYEPDVVVLEDTFVGINPAVSLALANINTSVPLKIIERVSLGKSYPSRFCHIQNGVWKGWIKRHTEKQPGEFKYEKKPKLLMQKRINALGFVLDYKPSEGLEDRYDALCMALGWWLCYVNEGIESGDIVDEGTVERLTSEIKPFKLSKSLLNVLS